MKTREGGFTLVELLIVIMIIAILVGMLMLATGMSMNSVEAAKVINDLRNLKSAAILFYGDRLVWPGPGDEAQLNNYSDRPIVIDGTAGRYTVIIGGAYPDPNNPDISRVNIGIELTGAANSDGVKEKLANKARDAGLLNTAQNAAEIYDGSGNQVWMSMR